MSDRVWIEFEEAGTSDSGKTQRWVVRARQGGGGGVLGTITWYGPWRGYVFTAVPGCVFEQDCLRTIATFCEDRTHNHKAAKAS